MSEWSRRDVIKVATATGLATAAVAVLAESAEAQLPADRLAQEQAVVQRCGLTASESDCWVLTAQLADTVLKLPDMTQEDRQELTTAIHLIQNKLLSRPTVRRYAQLTQGLQ